MPIRPELRHLYCTPEWRELRDKLFKQARGRCSICKKPHRLIIYTYTWQTYEIVDGRRVKRYHMCWARANGRAWRDQNGKLMPKGQWPAKGLPRRIRAIITVAHLDHQAEHMAEENLGVLCTWHHLHHDMDEHRSSRARRKDLGRPILQELNHHVA
jgi:hypothetical protein